ncbi:MAG: helix-turn-helix domain-containing protein [Chloroflexota bacterium]|nr:helix-turn-helix domain-containing protein [Chloroflexota bacterium]
MDAGLTFGEYVRRLRRRKRWQLQELATATGLSVTHLSRIENDSAVPNPDTVVKLSNALGGEMELMLQMADCLPREILDRLVHRAADGGTALKRSAGNQPADLSFPQALIEDIDPSVRTALAKHFGLSETDIDGLFGILQRVARMAPAQRAAVLKFLAASTRAEGQ